MRSRSGEAKSPMPNPVDNEDLYDAIVLGTKRSPGIVVVSGHDRNQRWDVKEPIGHGGGTTTYKGETIAQFQCEFRLTRDPVLAIDDFAAWEVFAAFIKSMLPKSGAPKATPIYHPDLAANDIKTVSQASIGGMAHDGKGGAKIIVKFLEYRPPKKTTGLATKPTKAPGTDDPNADVKAQLRAATEEAKKAKAELQGKP